MSTNIQEQVNSEVRPVSTDALPLELPGPIIWKMKDLCNFLGVSTSWVYKRSMKNALDRIPCISGVGRLSFHTKSHDFLEWMQRQLQIRVAIDRS